MKKFQDISLLHYNTFGIDVRSRSLICYESEDELIDLIRNSKEELQQPILNMGAGSNLLFLKDFKGYLEYLKIQNNGSTFHNGFDFRSDFT